jgi:hypothetical protein
MADNATIIGLVALTTALFTGIGVILKYVKHSECMRGCCEIDTRASPTRMDSVISAIPPTPQRQKRKRHNAESKDTEEHDKEDEKKSEFNLDNIIDIIDTDV